VGNSCDRQEHFNTQVVRVLARKTRIDMEPPCIVQYMPAKYENDLELLTIEAASRVQEYRSLS
jgi:hypothetical protein